MKTIKQWRYWRNKGTKHDLKSSSPSYCRRYRFCQWRSYRAAEYVNELIIALTEVELQVSKTNLLPLEKINIAINGNSYGRTREYIFSECFSIDVTLEENKSFGNRLYQPAQNGKEWHREGEAYVQEWTAKGWQKKRENKDLWKSKNVW